MTFQKYIEEVLKERGIDPEELMSTQRIDPEELMSTQRIGSKTPRAADGKWILNGGDFFIFTDGEVLTVVVGENKIGDRQVAFFKSNYFDFTFDNVNLVDKKEVNIIIPYMNKQLLAHNRKLTTEEVELLERNSL